MTTMQNQINQTKSDFKSFLEKRGLEKATINRYLSVIEWKMCRDHYNTKNITYNKNLFAYTDPQKFDDIKNKLLENPCFQKDRDDSAKGSFGDHVSAMNRYSEFLYTLQKDMEAELDEVKYHFNEGNKKPVSHTVLVRSRAAREKSIEFHGYFCNICGFDFEKTYGDIGKHYIEVHHITLIGKLSSAEGYEGTDPEHDLIPVCSNCHAIIHRKNPPYTPDEICKKLGMVGKTRAL